MEFSVPTGGTRKWWKEGLGASTRMISCLGQGQATGRVEVMSGASLKQQEAGAEKSQAWGSAGRIRIYS